MQNMAAPARGNIVVELYIKDRIATHFQEMGSRHVLPNLVPNLLSSGLSGGLGILVRMGGSGLTFIAPPFVPLHSSPSVIVLILL